MKLNKFMAKACHYAQEHIGDPDAWGMDTDGRTQLLQCVSYQMACFFAQNTVDGKKGVEWEVILNELVSANPPVKSEAEWLRIINKTAKALGGWKK